MNQELKARWITALRSGVYKQGKGRLRSTEDRFCCLGVLYDLERRGGWIPTAGGYETEETNSDLFVPVELLDGNVQYTLTKSNDSGDSFKEIADWLEQHDV